MAGVQKAKKKGRKKSAPELTEAEWAIMKVVWEKGPCAAGTVQDALEKSRGWAYSTVKSTMDRMVDKGFLEIEKIRNLQLFRSRITETQARKNELRRMLKRAFDGALTPMMQFLIENEELSKDDFKQLRRIVNKAEKERK